MTVEAALQYLNDGFSIVPVQAGTKDQPLVAWKAYQTTRPTEDQVREWWGKWPDANIAVITGQVSNLTVIDVDGQLGLNSIYENQITPPTTRVVQTPNGWHLYYRYNSDYHTGAGFLPGLDVRSDGGYVIAPPSRVNGGEYRVLRDNAITTITLVSDVFRGRTRQTNGHKTGLASQDRPAWVNHALTNGVAEGQRNEMAARLVGYFHGHGLPRDVIAEVLRPFAEKCHPPMDEREMERTIESVTRYAVKVKAARISDPPVMRKEADAFIYDWANHGIEVRVDQITLARDGVHCEIQAEAKAPGVQPVLYGPVRMNLSSATAKEGMARYMNKQFEADWNGIVEAVCRLTIGEVRGAGEVLDLRDVDPGDDEDQYALEPLLLENLPTMFIGDGGTGKSLVALAAAMTLQTGERRILGLEPRSYHVCLYLDFEFASEQHARRFRQIANGVGIDASTITVKYRRCSGSLASQVPQIRKAIAESGASLVIVDSVGIASGKPSEDAETVQFFEALRSLNVTAILIAHVVKNGESNGKAFGSVYWNNYSRSVWEVKAHTEPGDTVLRVGLYHRKGNTSKRHATLGWDIQFGADAIRFIPAAVADTPELAASLGVRERIMAALRGGRTATINEIADELEINPSTVKTTLHRNERTFVSIAGGKPGAVTTWALRARDEHETVS